MEVYWLTRVGVIDEVARVMLILSGMALVLFPIMCSLMELEDAEWFKPRTAFRWLAGMFIVGLLLKAFVPTKQDLYLIYGLGTVIEYMEGNDKVKEIPDKAVDAMIEWMEMDKEEKK